MTVGTINMIRKGRLAKNVVQRPVQMGQVFAEGVFPGGNEPVNSFPADVIVQVGEDMGIDIHQFFPIGFFLLDANSFRML